MTDNSLQWHIRKSLNIAIPVMLSQVGHIITNIADAIMLGQLGEVPLAAASLGHSVYIIPFMFATGFTFGLTPLVASHDASDEHEQAASLLKNSLVIFLLMGLGMVIVLMAFSPFLAVLGSPDEVTVKATPYLRWITLSILPFMLFQSMKQFAEGLSDTRMAMYIIIGCNLINILGNYLLIFGNWGFPMLGVEGAGIASAVSRVLMPVCFFIYLKKNQRFQKFLVHWKHVVPSRKQISRLTGMGLPISFQYVFEIGAFSMAVIMMGWLGATQQAAHQIAINLAGITYMAASGIGSSAAVRVGNQMGLKDWVLLRRLAGISYSLSIVFMSVMAILFVIFNHQLPLIYISEQEVIEMASRLILVAAVFQLADGIQVTGLGILRGMQDVKIPTLITMLSYWIIGIPVSYIFGFTLHQGAMGIWYGLSTGLFVAAVLLYLRYKRLLVIRGIKKAPEKGLIY